MSIFMKGKNAAQIQKKQFIKNNKNGLQIFKFAISH